MADSGIPPVNQQDWRQHPKLPVDVSKQGYVRRTASKSLLPMRASWYGHRTVRVAGQLFPQGVHRLVYETWAGEIPAELIIHHLDGDPGNNDVENLQPWKVNIRVGKRDLHLGYAADINIAAAMRAKANKAYDFSPAPHLPCGNPTLVRAGLRPSGPAWSQQGPPPVKVLQVHIAWRDELFAKFGMKMSLNGSVTKIENTELLEEEVSQWPYRKQRFCQGWKRFIDR
ncbi:hypothetical protein HDU89_005907 [Geranomyces variabilis]|nr:hypothetical protein HDU89_005907 [Geranomyces variabilis]